MGLQKGGGRYESGKQPGGAPGDRRIGVVWHTQGAGKSLTMAFYAGGYCSGSGDGESDDCGFDGSQRSG